MSPEPTATEIKDWIDDDLVESIEQTPDEHAEFNLLIEMSNILLHVIRQRPGGPVLIGQEIEYSDDITNRIRELPATARNDLVARIRETLTMTPIVYGFRDAQGSNVRFKDMSRIFLEARIYPDGLSQQSLMETLIAVWKSMRYLDDIVTLLDATSHQH